MFEFPHKDQVLLTAFDDLLLMVLATLGLVSLHPQGIELLLHASTLCRVLLTVVVVLQGSHHLQKGHELKGGTAAPSRGCAPSPHAGSPCSLQ